MKKEVWVCLVHTNGKPSVISSDGYSSLSKAQDALCLRLHNEGYWQDEFNYVQQNGLKHYELKCITLEA